MVAVSRCGVNAATALLAAASLATPTHLAAALRLQNSAGDAGAQTGPPGLGTHAHLEAVTDTAKAHFQSVYTLRDQARQLLAEQNGINREEGGLEQQSKDLAEKHAALKQDLRKRLSEDIERSQTSLKAEQNELDTHLKKSVQTWTEAVEKRGEESKAALAEKKGIVTQVRELEQKMKELHGQEDELKAKFVLNKGKVNGLVTAYKYAETKLGGFKQQELEAETHIKLTKEAVSKQQEIMKAEEAKVEKHLTKMETENAHRLKKNAERKQKLKQKLKDVKKQLEAWKQRQALLRKNMLEATKAYEKAQEEKRQARVDAVEAFGKQKVGALKKELGWKDGEDWAYGDVKGEAAVDKLMAGGAEEDEKAEKGADKEVDEESA